MSTKRWISASYYIAYLQQNLIYTISPQVLSKTVIKVPSMWNVANLISRHGTVWHNLVLSRKLETICFRIVQNGATRVLFSFGYPLQRIFCYISHHKEEKRSSKYLCTPLNTKKLSEIWLLCNKFCATTLEVFFGKTNALQFVLLVKIASGTQRCAYEILFNQELILWECLTTGSNFLFILGPFCVFLFPFDI